MNLVKELTYKIVNPEPISEDALAKARYKFRELLIDAPDTLVVHPYSYGELLAQMKSPLLDLGTIHGMLVQVDASLDDDEWYIKKTDSRTEEVK